MVLSMKENGMSRLVIDMVEVIRYGVMAVFMKDIGKTTKLTAVDVLFMQMVIFMMVNGKMTKLMVLVNTLIQTELNMRVTG